MERIFKLIRDTHRESDMPYDAFLRSFTDSEKLPYYFLNPILYSTDLLPAKLYFDADFDMISKYDFPFTDTGIFIVSLKVKEIFERFADFSFFQVPVVMFDSTVLDARFNVDGTMNRAVPVNEQFVALRFPELKSYFDFERSIYRVPKSNPKGVRGIKKLVLTNNGERFPAIFTTHESVTSVFVREDLKKALEDAQVVGCSFLEVECS